LPLYIVFSCRDIFLRRSPRVSGSKNDIDSSIENIMILLRTWGIAPERIFAYNHLSSYPSCHLRVKASQVRDIPWVPDGLSIDSILESIRTTGDHLVDNVGSFPWRCELPYILLFVAQHQVSLAKRSIAHSTAVVIVQVLLVDRRSRRSYVTCFVDQVYIIFECGV
jgi:hypothetical protein